MPRDEWEGFLEWLWDFEFNKLGIPKPDATVYLEMPPAVFMELINSRSNDMGRVKDIHETNVGHLKKSYSAALYSSEKLGWEIVHCCDGDNKLRTREDIFADILSKLGL